MATSPIRQVYVSNGSLVYSSRRYLESDSGRKYQEAGYAAVRGYDVNRFRLKLNLFCDSLLFPDGVKSISPLSLDNIQIVAGSRFVYGVTRSRLTVPRINSWTSVGWKKHSNRSRVK